jgi:protein O-mannosyl-transferase
MGEPRAEPPTQAWGGARFGVATLIVLAAVIVYHRVSGVPFLFDDQPAVVRNESIRHLWPLASVLQPPITAAGAAGRPLVNVTLAANYAAGGLEPSGYHWFNVGLHTLTALVLWGVLRRTLTRVPSLRAARESLAATIALLWTVHPLTTESVVCVVQRNELLAALFLLLTLYCFIRSRESASHATRWEVMAVACCALGMASKEVMAGAPLVVLLYDATFVAGTFATAWRERRRFYAGLASTWLLLALLIAEHQHRAGTVGFGLGMSAWSYAATQCRALVTYLQLALWPAPLVLDYGFDAVAGWSAVWPQAILVAVLLLATVWSLRRRTPLGFAAAACFILLAPSSSFLPLTTQTIAEHRMYLPLALVVAIVVIALWRIAGQTRGGLVAAGLLALGWATSQRVELYRNETTIWADTVAKAPANARAHASLANAWVHQGRLDLAAGEFETAVRLRPDYADAQNDYANVLAHTGKIDASLAHYEAAAKLKPDDGDIRYNYAIALAQAGRIADALDQLTRVVAQDPQNAKAHNNLGDALLKTGRTADALREFQAAIAADPESAAAYNNAGIALVVLGRFSEAATQYGQAVQRMPGSAQVHHNLALALDGAGDLRGAIAAEETALRLAPNFAAAREHLARLQAQGRAAP